MAETDSTPLSISWCNTIGTRDGLLTHDAKMINCFVDKTPNGNALVKRGGSRLDSPLVTGVAQGVFSDGSKYIVSNTVYSRGNVTAPASLPGAPSPPIYPFVSTVFSTQQGGIDQTIVIWATPGGSSNNAWTYNVNTNTFIKITDAVFTGSVNIQPSVAYLDGVYYVMDINGQIKGSAIKDPTTWPALDFTQADIQYGNGKGVVRHLNYILGFYEQGMQVYYDGNAAPNGQGIALLPVLSASFRTGTPSILTCKEIDDVTYFLGQSYAGWTVQSLNGLTMAKISTPAIERILNQDVQAQNMWAAEMRTHGHVFYLLTLLPQNITLAYDITSGEWGIWQSVVHGATQYFAYWTGAAAMLNGISMVGQEIYSGALALFSDDQYADTSGIINVTAVTPDYDWGTLNWKRFGYGNQFADTIHTTISISYSDDDYQTFSTPRTIDLSTVRKQIRNCGSSRRRAWMLQHSDTTPLRVYDFQWTSTAVPR